MSPVPCLEIPPAGPERHRLAVLHSNGMCGRFYVPLAERLGAEGVRSFLFDIPGFAGAPAVEPLGWTSLLHALEQAIRERAGADCALMGHSLGGLVGLQLAPRLALRALILMEPAIFPWRWLARLGAAIYVRRVFDDGPPRFRNRGPWFWRLHDPDAFPAELHQLVLDSHAGADRELVAVLHRELPERYPLPFDAVRAPTLVIRGASSGPVMALGQRDLVKRLPSATPVTIADAGHWLANEQDEAIAAAILGHLRTTPTS